MAPIPTEKGLGVTGRKTRRENSLPLVGPMAVRPHPCNLHGDSAPLPRCQIVGCNSDERVERRITELNTQQTEQTQAQHKHACSRKNSQPRLPPDPACRLPAMHSVHRCPKKTSRAVPPDRQNHSKRFSLQTRCPKPSATRQIA